MKILYSSIRVTVLVTSCFPHSTAAIPSVAVPSSEGEGEDSGSGGEGSAAAPESGVGGVERLGGAVTVCAGLTYLTQLINTLAFYLDVTLPKKLCYRYGT